MQKLPFSNAFGSSFLSCFWKFPMLDSPRHPGPEIFILISNQM